MRRLLAPSSSRAGQRRVKATQSKGAKKPKSATAQRRSGLSKPEPSLILPSSRQISASQRQAQNQARRRRRTARQVRRFESLVARVPATALKGVDIRHQLRKIQPTGLHWRPSHLLSLCLFILAFGGIGWVHYDDEWYVYREYVTFSSLTYHTNDELYKLIDVDGWNIFWLSTSTIQNRLVALPTINDAQVTITPPHWVTIDIEETKPVALWVTQEGDFWLLPDGTALTKIDERYDPLPQIVDHLREASSWGDVEHRHMDPQILASALALLERVPAIENLYFNSGYGLNFHMPGSQTWVYWGDGNNAEQKYDNLLAIAQDLRAQQQTVSIVDVRFDKPVIK